MSKLANVAFPLPLNQLFTYKIPDRLSDLAQVGCRVVAPFGRRRLIGFIVELPRHSEFARLRVVEDVLDASPLISQQTLRLCEWIADYYLASLGEALKATVPSVLLEPLKQQVRLTTERPQHYAALLKKTAPRQANILQVLSNSSKFVSVGQLQRKVGTLNLFYSLRQLQAKRLLLIEQQRHRKGVAARKERYVSLSPIGANPRVADGLKQKAPRQALCLEILRQVQTRMNQKELLQKTGASLSTLKSLVDKEFIVLQEEIVFRDYYGAIDISPPKQVQLTDEQASALQKINAAIERKSFDTFLLFGITGSGKTQVYIEAIKRVLAAGREAIVLVPEIALTPQIVQRFRSHFQDRVAVLHSAMSDGERFDSWQKIRAGDASVVIGPRSAIFAPLRNVGLVVVDEEHESSYKQSESAPRYHARDVAVVLAKQNDAAVILGSATPSAESFHNGLSEKYKLISLTKRATEMALPEVRIVDMLKEKRILGQRKELVFSRILAQKIEERVAAKQQVILLLNRRGFSSYIKCHECGFIEECENCNISLTYHLRGRRLRCHYCGFSKPAPASCPECCGSDIVFKGLGTQRVEKEIEMRFPQARLVRMDLDTTSRKWSHDRILTDFGAGKYDILLGTQMVAKGLDFSQVTLVGVVNADVGLLLPDFRASERTFQLLTQVAGRAGRQELPGEVVIQTYSPEHFCLTCARGHDFQAFYYGDIAERKELDYPPFGRTVCVHFRGENETSVANTAKRFAHLLRKRRGRLSILGPTPSPIERIQNLYRYQLLVKVAKTEPGGAAMMRGVVRNAFEQFQGKNAVRVTVDVDPVSTL